MIVDYKIIYKELNFIKPATTSRGVYHVRPVHYLAIFDEYGNMGVGECASLHDLSIDAKADKKKLLASGAQQLMKDEKILFEKFRSYPSVLFALETAYMHLEQKCLELMPSPWTRGLIHSMPINGLVWMGDYDTMLKELQHKLDLGFKCIKLKIGAIDFKQECQLLEIIRSTYSAKQLQLRVDANGAFNGDNVFEILDKLSSFDLHSIEQPVRAGQHKLMRRIVKSSPLAIALDEELIPLVQKKDKHKMLELVKPHYIILKPSLHGGIKYCLEWIEIAKSLGIDYWFTSALESNIGLNAIAQLAAATQVKYKDNPQNPRVHGLGTGQLFSDNAPSPLLLQGQNMHFDQDLCNSINLATFLGL